MTETDVVAEQSATDSFLSEIESCERMAAFWSQKDTSMAKRLARSYRLRAEELKKRQALHALQLCLGASP